MDILHQAESLLLSLANIVPLELFVFIGSFVEEVVAPIPSPIIMITAGSVASLQGRLLSGLVILSFIGAVGKTLGGYILYTLADKTEDILTTRFGKLIGISHQDIEGIGKYFNKGKRDDIILFLIRCLPVVPSAPLSLGAGIIKISLKTFLWTTFAGTIVRDSLFLYFGYSGLQSFNLVIQGLDSVESVVQIGIFFVLGVTIGIAYWKRHKNHSNNK